MFTPTRGPFPQSLLVPGLLGDSVVKEADKILSSGATIPVVTMPSIQVTLELQILSHCDPHSDGNIIFLFLQAGEQAQGSQRPTPGASACLKVTPSDSHVPPLETRWPPRCRASPAGSLSWGTPDNVCRPCWLLEPGCARHRPSTGQGGCKHARLRRTAPHSRDLVAQMAGSVTARTPCLRSRGRQGPDAPASVVLTGPAGEQYHPAHFTERKTEGNRANKWPRSQQPETSGAGV